MALVSEAFLGCTGCPVIVEDGCFIGWSIVVEGVHIEKEEYVLGANVEHYTINENY
ncbi:MAG: hypothetical protein R2764_07110 [Bacteroidales bacterium]